MFQHIALEQHEPPVQRFHEALLIRKEQPKLTPIPRPPVPVQVQDHADQAIAPAAELVAVPLVEGAWRVVREMELPAGKREVAVPVQQGQQLFHALEERLQVRLPSPVQPVYLVAPYRRVNLMVGQGPDAGLVEVAGGQVAVQGGLEGLQDVRVKDPVQDQVVLRGEPVEQGEPVLRDPGVHAR